METLAPADLAGGRLARPGRYAVLFYATWCPFCRSFLPEFEELDGKVGGHLARIDISDEASPLWESYRIEVVPSILGFEEGRAAWRYDGALGRGLGARELDALLRRLGAASRGS